MDDLVGNIEVSESEQHIQPPPPPPAAAAIEEAIEQSLADVLGEEEFDIAAEDIFT